MRALDLLALQDKEAVENSFYRYPPKVSPNIEIQQDKAIIKTADTTVEIDYKEEAALYLIADFKFCPYWQLQRWLEKDIFDTVTNWMAVGLVWLETSSMGVFVRPTKLLFDLMKIEDTNFIQIPFGLLNHTVSEAQVAFDMMSANKKSELYNMIQERSSLLPGFSPLGIETKGTVIIKESYFRQAFYNNNELIQKVADLENDIKSGKPLTLEFADWKLFQIYLEQDGKFTTKVPDLVVPVPRIDGKPQSYAIEVELSAKPVYKYEHIMKQYKDNLVYGHVVYLCGSTQISDRIRKAYKNVGGIGNCQLYVIPFYPPSMTVKDVDFLGG